MKHIFKKIKEYNRIIIHGHVRPDGDCYGSQFGLKNIINTTFPDKEVYLVGGKCEHASFLGSMDTVTDEMFKGAISIVVDCGDSKRIDDKRINLADYVIKIDHHIPVDNYGDYQFVQEEKPACCQIIAEFYDKFKKKLKITKEGAMALYTGMVTDTGRFRFDSVKSDTFKTAALLLDLGVNVEEIDAKLSIENLNTLKLKGYVLSNFKMTENGFAYVCITRDVVNEYQVSDEEAANQVNLLSSLEQIPVWALFMEYPGEIRIRLRSKGPAIDLLANNYGGGGHEKASGAKLITWDDLPKFVDECDLLVKKYKLEKN